MRAFIGLTLDKEFKKELYEIQKIVKDSSNKGSWVPIDNFHITLKFLGNIDEGQIENIDRKIKSRALNISPISISLEKLDYFNMKNTEYGVIWLGINGELLKLNHLYDIIESDMTSIGFPMEKRKFTPHITLGRRVRVDLSFHKLEESIRHKLGKEYLLDNLALMKSEEDMNKRVYTPIKFYKFVKNIEKNHR